MIIRGYEHHLYLIIWKAGPINYLVKINLINKYFDFFSVLVVPCRLINLYNFLRYHVKGLNSRDPLIYYYKYGPLLFFSHYTVMLGCTSKRYSKCYGGQEYPA